MKLLIDVGNTAVKYAVADEDNIRVVKENDIEWHKITSIICSQVGKGTNLQAINSRAAEFAIPLEQAYVSSARAGVTCAYPAFQNLGIDRWLTVLAAHALYPTQDVIVIDSGTATTVDVVTAQGQHLGGWIVPGLDLMTTSITARAERVFCDDNTPFLAEFAKNTPEAVKNGALAAMIGLVQSAKLQLDNKSALVLCTGGYGKLIKQHVDLAVFDDLLVFKGLLVWWKNPQ
ncbi:type III pantothenate kinase [Pseudoalteromonas peptidolytica]|uniref:Type III pantothenate kinase n=1 Tax=Pseudoalteromonas peptidolytica F12-50-A1 TaxID=1315280 RepID=A0A8I0MYD0_9GAMM|nr:type III pantothenate kinase [Pseudoalteromonas peptidolytica]MBE0348111.1 type III pantothenate kinase [Pseudoalteromonas peptidolytica F12-50-A1]NLR15711.1 type III pantothenate kinase [Pseudoalteromonas peptidolytica]GEK10579.1 type III pantothenate kinase [Pseudoalteromonas peptidolytica]